MYEVKGGTRAKQFIHEIDKLSRVSQSQAWRENLSLRSGALSMFT